VVFQLITFFMLVINFSNDNYDSRIKLPVAGSARPLDEPSKAQEDRLVLNIDRRGQLLFNGKTFSSGQAAEQIKFEAQLARVGDLSDEGVDAVAGDEGRGRGATEDVPHGRAQPSR